MEETKRMDTDVKRADQDDAEAILTAARESDHGATDGGEPDVCAACGLRHF